LIQQQRGEIINEYSRVVTEEGNLKAQQIMVEVFERSETKWRGIGIIPASGMKLREAFSDFDAEIKFPVSVPEEVEHRGCRCGEVLRGLLIPSQCPLFGKKCTPENPVGACMVSSEGSCAAYFKYQRFGHE
jgi:hydrogenase expression/formation protein HypD